MDDNNLKKENHKKKYIKPELVVHGDLAKLTEAKGGGANDGGGKPKSKAGGMAS